MRTLEQTRTILGEVTCKPYEFLVGCFVCGASAEECAASNGTHPWFIQAKMWRKDTYSNQDGWGYGGRYLVTPTATVEELVKKCFVAARDYAEHEVREAFMWRGRRILGPHINLKALWFIADQTEDSDVLPPENIEIEQAAVQAEKIEKIMRHGMMDHIGQHQDPEYKAPYPARGREV